MRLCGLYGHSRATGVGHVPVDPVSFPTGLATSLPGQESTRMGSNKGALKDVYNQINAPHMGRVQRRDCGCRSDLPLFSSLVRICSVRAFPLCPDGCWWRLYGVCWGIVVTLGPACSARLVNGSNLRFSGSSAGAEGLCQL